MPFGLTAGQSFNAFLQWWVPQLLMNGAQSHQQNPTNIDIYSHFLSCLNAPIIGSFRTHSC